MRTKNASKYLEGQLIEFKDYQDLKNYVGIISSIIYSSTDPLTDYYYVLDKVNFGSRENPNWKSGICNGIQIVEKNIIRSIREISVKFLLENGWFLSSDPNHIKDLYVKNRYPVGIHHDKDDNLFWAYNPAQQIRYIHIMEPLRNEKEYDEFIMPFLHALKNNK